MQRNAEFENGCDQRRIVKGNDASADADSHPSPKLESRPLGKAGAYGVLAVEPSEAGERRFVRVASRPGSPRAAVRSLFTPR